MSIETTLTLPGSIPGLLRRGSPVLLAVVGDDGAAVGARGVVVMLGREGGGPRTALVAVEVGDVHATRTVWRLLFDLALDLTDATGRAHAAWFAIDLFDRLFADSFRMPGDARRALSLATAGADMTPEQIEALRLVVLHVAGVSP